MLFRSDSVIYAVIRLRWTVIAVCCGITLVAAFFMTKIRVDNDPTHTVPKNLHAMVDYERLQATFRSPRTILLIAQFDDDLPLFEKIDSISAWARRFDSIEGIDNVVHIGSVQSPVKGGFLGIKSDYLVPRDREEDTEDLIRQRVRESHRLTGMLISPDEKTFSMMMDIDESYNQIDVVSRVDELKAQIARHAPARIFITGGALYTYYVDRTMRRDFSVLLPLCLVVVFVLLYLIYRRIGYVVVSLGVTAIALVWTFGLMGAMRMPFSIAVSIIPIILFPIGVATAIHILRTHDLIAVSKEGDGLAAIAATFRELMNPIFLSAITTFAGFASFAFSRVTWTRVFGIFTSIGVLASLLLSIALLPIFLFFCRSSSHRVAGSGALQKRQWWTAWLWSRYWNFIRSPYQWFLLAGLILVIGLIGFLRVRVEGNPIAMFSVRSDIRKNDAYIERYLGGTRFLFAVLEKTDSGPLETASQWRSIAQIVRFAENNPLVGRSFSLVPLMEKISEMFGDSTISDAAVSMLLKSGSLLGKRLNSYVRAWLTPDHRRTKVTFVCSNAEGTLLGEFAHRLRNYVSQEHPEFTVLIAGPPLLNEGLTFLLIDTQKQSLAIAIVLVFGVLCMLFRSVKFGIFAIIPILFSAVFVYAMMGFVGVAIDAITVVIVNTCLGIGIDYSIHFTAGYRYLLTRYGDDAEALRATLSLKGRVIMLNTLVVGVGFLVLAFSSFPPIRNLGVFVCVSMMASAGFSLTFLPVLFRYLRSAPARLGANEKQA